MGRTTTRAATVGYEAQLWQMVGGMDAAEHRHVVLGQLNDMIGNIPFTSPRPPEEGPGARASHAHDVLGEAYGYLFSQHGAPCTIPLRRQPEAS